MKRVFLSLLIFSWFGLFAQRAAVQKGDISFESYEYGQAIGFYLNALDKEEEPAPKQYLNAQIALCYTRLFQYTKAEEYFSMVMGSGEEVKPELYLEYGNVLKLNGKYAEAKNQFVKYREYSHSNDAGGYVQSVEWAINNTDITNNSYRIFLTNLDVSGQSLGYCYYGNGLVYSTGRNKTSNKNKKAIFDIEYAINENSLEFTGRKNFFSKINFEWNELSPSITKDENSMYFAANATRIKNSKVQGGLELNKNGIANYKIYMASKRDAEFQDIQELPFNNNEYSCLHPCILNDGTTLIFSSDKPGGFGGFDLYRSVLSNDSVWGEPVNLGATVNSTENEIFPWVNSGLLFFASKGFNGYGGYDIFIAGLNNENMPVSLKNIGLPINSFRDDVAYITNDSGGTGYFSSNRNTDNGADQVYFFKESQAGKLAFNAVDGFDSKNKLRGQLLDSIGYTALRSVDQSQLIGFQAVPVPDPTVEKETGSDGKKHKEAIAVKPEGGVTPALIAAAAVTVSVTITEGKGKEVKEAVPLSDSKEATEKPNNTTPEIKPIAVQIPSVEKKKPETVQTPTIQEFAPILFEFDDARITSAQKHTADSLVILFRRTAGQKIQIDAYTDSRGSAQYNMGLSNRRASSVKQYLVQKGIPAGKITAKGLGESELLNECIDGASCTEEQHAVNRRVVIKLIAK